MTRYELTSSEGSFEVDIEPSSEGWRAKLEDEIHLLRLKRVGSNVFIVEIGGKPLSVTLLEASSQRVDLVLGGERLTYQRPAAILGQAPIAPVAVSAKDVITAPMPGKVIAAMVKKGERVRPGDPLVILESMKMEIAVRSDRDAEVSEILAADGASVRRGQGLVRLSD